MKGFGFASDGTPAAFDANAATDEHEELIELRAARAKLVRLAQDRKLVLGHKTYNVGADEILAAFGAL